jgi:hypothetical protein
MRNFRCLFTVELSNSPKRANTQENVMKKIAATIALALAVLTGSGILATTPASAGITIAE